MQVVVETLNQAISIFLEDCKASWRCGDDS